MFNVIDNPNGTSSVFFNRLLVKQCPNQAVAIQLAIHLSNKYGELAEFQIEAQLSA